MGVPVAQIANDVVGVVVDLGDPCPLPFGVGLEAMRPVNRSRAWADRRNDLDLELVFGVSKSEQYAARLKGIGAVGLLLQLRLDARGQPQQAAA